jgi:sarcosine oxidase subunit beta
MWVDWAEHLGHSDETGMAKFVETGAFVIDAPPFPTDHVLTLLSRAHVPYERWDEDMVRRRLPGLDTGSFFPPVEVSGKDFWGSPAGVISGFFMPNGGFVDDPQLATHNLMTAAKACGARFIFRKKVIDILVDSGRVQGVILEDGTAIDTPILVNAAGPHSSVINEMAGALEDMRITTRALRQEVHVVRAPETFELGGGATLVIDLDLGTYFRPQQGGTVLLGGLEPECDPLEWISDPDQYNDLPTPEIWEVQTLRLARRLPELRIPNRPVGLGGLYDVSSDWMPIYDRSAIDGFYLACGTSGNQFKNAPMVGRLMSQLIDAVEHGHDHDRDPVTVRCERGPHRINIGHFSRLRDRSVTTNSVLG